MSSPSVEYLRGFLNSLLTTTTLHHTGALQRKVSAVLQNLIVKVINAVTRSKAQDHIRRTRRNKCVPLMQICLPYGTLFALLFNFTFNSPTGGRSSLFPVWPSDWAPLTSWRSSGSITIRLYPFVSRGRSLSLCSCYNNACKLCLVPPAVPQRSISGIQITPREQHQCRGSSFNHWQSIANVSSLSGHSCNLPDVPGCLCSLPAT